MLAVQGPLERLSCFGNRHGLVLLKIVGEPQEPALCCLNLWRHPRLTADDIVGSPTAQSHRPMITAAAPGYGHLPQLPGRLHCTSVELGT